MKLHRYVDHQRLHIVTKDVISLSISVLLLFRLYISHKITFGAPSSGGVLRSACGAFIFIVLAPTKLKIPTTSALRSTGNTCKYLQSDVYIYQCEIMSTFCFSCSCFSLYL